MTSYFDEKGLPDPTFKKKSQSTSTNNPDVSHFFGSSNETSQNTEDYYENYSNMEQYFSLANLFGAIRDRQTGNGADTNQEFLDNLISQLLEEANANAKGPPPASKKFIQSLPIVPRSEIKVDETCPICAEKFLSNENTVVTRMPCKHLFDKECILPWLQLHNTCPSCRHEVESDDPAWKKKQLELLRSEDSEEEDPDWMYG